MGQEVSFGVKGWEEMRDLFEEFSLFLLPDSIIFLGGGFMKRGPKVAPKLQSFSLSFLKKRNFQERERKKYAKIDVTYKTKHFFLSSGLL